MRLAGNFLRYFSYVFETILCGAGLLLGAFALANAHVDVRVPWLPWTGMGQIRWIAGLSLAGLICVGLAVSGALRTLLFLFNAVVSGVLVRGLFMNTQYTFTGRSDARNAVILISGALLACVGAYPGFGRYGFSRKQGRRA